jgi:hypothetical protein
MEFFSCGDKLNVLHTAVVFKHSRKRAIAEEEVCPSKKKNRKIGKQTPEIERTKHTRK